MIAALLLALAQIGEATPMSLTVEEYKLVSDAAEPVCRRAVTTRNVMPVINAYAMREHYTPEMRLLLVTNCRMYATGTVDALQIVNRLLQE